MICAKCKKDDLKAVSEKILKRYEYYCLSCFIENGKTFRAKDITPVHDETEAARNIARRT